MVTILGIYIDLVSLIPALFGVLLSLYNWSQMRKPANIMAGRIVNYGFISSSYENALFFCFPLVFENSGANNGIITEIKLGFQYGGETKYIDTDARVRLTEFTGASAPQMNYEKFTDEGYRILLPTYPVKVEAWGSESMNIISTVSLEDKIFVAGKEGKMVVEVYFGANKMNKTEFAYSLSQASMDSDNVLIWLRMLDN